MFIVERVSALEHIFSFQTPSRVLGRGFEKKKYLGQSCFFSLIYLDYNIEHQAASGFTGNLHSSATLRVVFPAKVFPA